MRQQRDLAEHTWYNVWTSLNTGEPLFQFPWAGTLFYRVLRDANGIFGFEMRGLRLDGAVGACLGGAVLVGDLGGGAA